MTPLPARPLASVVVNNHDYERFVGAAIESALAQSHPCTEVVVVDDGSGDGSRQVIARYPGVRAVLKDNGGQASAYNAGIEASRGEVVLFLDADDTLLPHAVERAVAALRRPGCVKAHWPLREVDESGRATGRLLPSRPLARGELLPEVVRYGIPRGWPHGSGHAYRRAFLDRVVPVLDCGDRHGADSYLCVLAPVYGELAAIAEPLGCYRRHGTNFARGRSVRYRLERDARRYPLFLRWVEEHLRGRGIAADTAPWYGEGSALAWTRAALALDDDLAALGVEDSAIVLVDDGLIGSQTRPAARPMMERDGQYWGPPEDDAAAIAELERQRLAGATHIVFAAAAFWWLDHYRRFAEHLRLHYTRLEATASSVSFDLREARPAPPARRTGTEPAVARGAATRETG